MEFHGLHMLSLPLAVQDALIAVVAALSPARKPRLHQPRGPAAGLAHIARRASTRPARCVPGVRPGRRTNHLRTCAASGSRSGVDARSAPDARPRPQLRHASGVAWLPPGSPIGLVRQ